MSTLKQQIHHSILGLHQPALLMHARISKLFWHPTLLEQLQSAEKSCVLCRSEKITNTKQAFELSNCCQLLELNGQLIFAQDSLILVQQSILFALLNSYHYIQ